MTFFETKNYSQKILRLVVTLREKNAKIRPPLDITTKSISFRTAWTHCGHRSSLRLDVGGPDHLAPPLGLLGDELAEVGG
jgi:hypothetical protein